MSLCRLNLVQVSAQDILLLLLKWVGRTKTSETIAREGILDHLVLDYENPKWIML